MRTILLLFIISIAWTSCTLDLTPENSLTYTNAFATEAELNATTTSIEFFINAYIPENSAFRAAGSIVDELKAGNDTREWNPVTVANSNFNWEGLYNIIFESNLLLDNIHRTTDLTEDRYNFHSGQANFAIGLAYLCLAQRFGDCVITNNSSDILMYGNSPMIDVVNKAIEHGEAGYKQLPTFDKLKDLTGAAISNRQYASKGSCAALLSHLYAWKGSMIELYGLDGDADEAYRKSVEYASALIDKEAGDYELYDTPEELCTQLSNPDNVNKEAIFVITFDKAQSTTSMSPNLTGAVYLSWPVDETRLLGDITRTDYRLLKTTVDEVFPDKSDLRRAAYFYKLDDEDHIYSNKNYALMYKFRTCLYTDNQYVPGSKFFRSLNADQIYWRLADIILLRAECYAKLKQNSQAIDDLNRIRKRANFASYPSEYDHGDLRRAIFNERSRELIGETDGRYFDILRNNYISTDLHGKFLELTADDLKAGALSLPVPKAASVDNDGITINTVIRQKEYWIPYTK